MRRYAILGVVLLVVGVIGLIGTGLWLNARSVSRGNDSQGAVASGAVLGRQIFRAGTDQNGQPIPRSGAGMMGFACADCHGADGRGRRVRLMMGTFQTPDIRYSTLTTPREGEPAWTEREIKRAVEAGVDPSGGQLDWRMPRWDLSDKEFGALLDYLKELR